MNLRPYQTDLVARLRKLMTEGHRSILTVAPTGSGKTALTADMIRSAAAKRKTCWFLVHRRELLKQSMRAFDLVGVKYGVAAAGFYEDRAPRIQIASIQTLVKRHTRYRKPDLIVYDEAHHVAAGSWQQIIEANPQAYHIGLTATPERLDGAGLVSWFSHLVPGPTVAWLIEQGYLSPYRLFAPNALARVDLPTRMGEFTVASSAAALDKPTITGSAIREYQRAASGKRAVVFCASVQHSEHVVAEFNAAGIPAAHVDGETDPWVRDAEIQRFERGELRILSNVELFGEGFDLPGLDAVIMLRPTMSLGLYLQQVGRALRPVYAPGFDLDTAEGRRAAIAAGPKPYATLLDHVGNCERHGLPDDERDWTLDSKPRTKRDGESTIPVRICKSCFAAQAPGTDACRFCRAPFELQPRVVEQVEGELVEVDPEILRRQRRIEQGLAGTTEDLVALGRARGYKKPEQWAAHILRARQAAKLRGRV